MQALVLIPRRRHILAQAASADSDVSHHWCSPSTHHVPRKIHRLGVLGATAPESGTFTATGNVARRGP